MQGDRERRKTEPSGASQKFVRRIIQFILRIVERVNMQIELDPIVFRHPTHIHAHARVFRMSIMSRSVSMSRKSADKPLACVSSVSTMPPGTHASLFTESHWLSRKRSGGGMADTYV